MRKDGGGGGRGAMRAGPFRSTGWAPFDFREEAVCLGTAFGQFSTFPKKALDNLSRDPEMSSACSMVEIGGFGLALTTSLSAAGAPLASWAARPPPLFPPRRCACMVQLVSLDARDGGRETAASLRQSCRSGPLCFYVLVFRTHHRHCRSLSTKPAHGSSCRWPIKI